MYQVRGYPGGPLPTQSQRREGRGRKKMLVTFSGNPVSVDICSVWKSSKFSMAVGAAALAQIAMCLFDQCEVAATVSTMEGQREVEAGTSWQSRQATGVVSSASQGRQLPGGGGQWCSCFSVVGTD